MESQFGSERPLPRCPICDGVFELVYSRHGESVAICRDCRTGVTVPRNAWEIAKLKKAANTKPKQQTG